MKFVENVAELNSAIANQDYNLAGDVLYEAYGAGTLPSLTCLLGLLPVNDPSARSKLFDIVTLPIWLNWHICALLPWTYKLALGPQDNRRPTREEQQQLKMLRSFDNILTRELRIYMDVEPTSTEGQELRVLVVGNSPAQPPFMPWIPDALICVATANEPVVVGSKVERRALNKLQNRLSNLAVQLVPLVNQRLMRKVFPRDERNPY